MSSNFDLTSATTITIQPETSEPVLLLPPNEIDSEEGEDQTGYARLLTLTRIVLRSTTSEQALTEVFLYLKAHLHCVGIALETQEGVAARRRTQGNVEANFPAADTFSEGMTYTHLVFPLAPGVSGSIKFVFALQVGHTLEESHSLLHAVAQLMGNCIERERLRRKSEQSETSASRRIREVAALYEIGHIPSGGNIQNLLQLIVDRTALLMEAQACSIMLFDAERQCLHLEASHGLPPRAGANLQALGEGFAGRVAQDGKPLLISRQTRHDPRLEGVTLRADIGSAMLVPMKNQEGVILGVLSIRRKLGHAEFIEDDVKLFSVFASQAALALANARLLEDLKQRAGELSKLSSLSRALLSTTDLEALLQTVITDICIVGGFDRCCLYLRDVHRPMFTPRVLNGYPESLGRNIVKEGEGAVGRVARSGELLLFDSQEPVTEETARSASYRQLKGFARSLGAKAFVAVPILTSKETCIAVLVADNQRKHTPLSREQTNLLQAFVSQAGIAIENALLYDQMHDTVAKLRRLTDYTNNVLQSIEAAILTTDARGQIMRCNRAAELLLKASARHLRACTLEQAFDNLHLPHDEQEHLLQTIKRVQDTGERIHRLKLTLHPQNRPATTFYLMVSRLPERAHGQTEKAERAGVVIIFEDVTQEMRLEAELEKMRRLADIGQLAAKMAHEVRNALSPIKGAAQLMRSESENSEWSDIIIAEVDGLSRLTSEMLNFARPTPLDPTWLDLNILLKSALQSLASFLSENHTRLCWELKEGIPLLMADEVQLRQVIRNIVMNAAQSMPQGGTLTVQSDWKRETERVTMRFADTGIGIAPEERERIFQPFVTTRPKGTGLGLPIVQKNVDNHGGRVEVESVTGQGTCISVWLPLVPPVEGERPKPPTMPPGAPDDFPADYETGY